jgi:hypothetical protein
MGRVEPFATYFGVVGFIIGGIGAVVGLDAPRLSTTSGPVASIAAAAPVPRDSPLRAAAPVAFYGEMLHLVAMPPTPSRVTGNTPTPFWHTVGQSRVRGEVVRSDASPAHARNRTSSTATIIVHRSGKGSAVYRVGRD